MESSAAVDECGESTATLLAAAAVDVADSEIGGVVARVRDSHSPPHHHHRHPSSHANHGSSSAKKRLQMRTEQATNEGWAYQCEFCDAAPFGMTSCPAANRTMRHEQQANQTFCRN